MTIFKIKEYNIVLNKIVYITEPDKNDAMNIWHYSICFMNADPIEMIFDTESEAIKTYMDILSAIENV